MWRCVGDSAGGGGEGAGEDRALPALRSSTYEARQDRRRAAGHRRCAGTGPPGSYRGERGGERTLKSAGRGCRPAQQGVCALDRQPRGGREGDGNLPFWVERTV